MNDQSRVAESQDHAMVLQRLYYILFTIDATLAMEVNDIIKKSRRVAESKGALDNQSSRRVARTCDGIAATIQESHQY